MNEGGKVAMNDDGSRTPADGRQARHAGPIGPAGLERTRTWVNG
ncbi:hypothetical protein [Streptomyces spiralis]